MHKFFQMLKLKKVWIPLLLVIVAVLAVGYRQQQAGKPQYTTESVKRQNLVQTVSATGTVEAAEQINLSAKVAGRITALPVKVGDKVKPGKVLAVIDSRDAQSAVLTARANLKSAEAALAKLKAGAQTENVAVSKAAVTSAETTLANARQSLENTKATQTQAVANAWAQLVGLPPVAVAAKTNVSTGSLTLSGTYNGTAQGAYTIRIINPNTMNYSVSGLETVVGSEGSRVTSIPLGTNGLRLQFSSTGNFVETDYWTITIPNTASSSYASYQAAYDAALTTQKQTVDTAEAAVRSAEQALAQAQAQLALVQAPPRSYDIESAQAAVDSVRATVLRAENDLGDRTLVAPVAGTITQVNNEVGETSSLAQPIVVLLSQGTHEVKVQVPESDIAKLKVGQEADMTLDAFGSGDHFSGHLSFINPASTVIQEVVYYEVTVLFDQVDDQIKPGMTVNLDVTTANRQQVLAVPLRAVKYDEERKPYVEVLGTDNQQQRKDVQLGLRGDDGLVEVIAGLNEGELVITSTK